VSNTGTEGAAFLAYVATLFEYTTFGPNEQVGIGFRVQGGRA